MHHTAPVLSTTVLVIAHVIIAIGILPGYRGVWRAMHLGGRTPATTVRRLWPNEASDLANTQPALPLPERVNDEPQSRTT